MIGADENSEDRTTSRDANRRIAALVLAAVSLLLVVIDIGGRALGILHLFDCTDSQFGALLALAEVGAACAGASVLYGCVAARSPGRGRVFVPVLGLVAGLVSIAILIDLLRPMAPVFGCPKF